MRRITDTSGTVHFVGIPGRHVTLCGASTATKDLLGNMIDRATETNSPCTCRECATLYAAIKNATWNEVQNDALDFGSLKRWRQLVAAKGEGEVREAAFAFWREVASGEDVANRGSALNARLGSLPDQAQGEHETNKTKEKTK